MSTRTTFFGFIMLAIMVLAQNSRGSSPPVINTQPARQVLASGSNVTLSVVATGTAPLSYQWYKNGPIWGATNTTLTLSNASLAASGVYYMVVTNASGMAISLPASVAVGGPELLAWGLNNDGQLGNGTTSNTISPGSLATNVVVAAAGTSHSLFVDSNGVLWATGNNPFGQLGNGTTTQETNPVSVASNVVAVAAGEWHSMFVKSDGTLWAMGNNAYGQLGDGTIADKQSPVFAASNVVAVAVGGFHSLFLANNGIMWAVGYNAYGQLGNGTTATPSNPVSVASNVVAVVAGGFHSMFVKSDYSLWGMGYNVYGQLGNGTTTNVISPALLATNVAVATGGGFTSMYVQTNGTLWGMGWNNVGQLGDGNTNQQNSPVSAASNVVTVAAENFHTFFLKNAGMAFGMGDDAVSELGDGGTNLRSSPVYVTNLFLASVISGCVDNSFTLAIGVPFPVFTVQPTNQTVTATSNVTFTVAGTGVGALSYQWYFNGSAVSNATAASYSLTSVMATNAGNYTVTIANNAGSVTSSVAVLTVNKAAGTVTLGSLNQTYSGAAASATAVTSPSGLTVNFTYNGASIAPTNAGSYTVIGAISDANYQGSATNTLVIANATVTITSGITANNKIYNGTTTATISSNNVSLSGVVAGDTANVALSTNGYTALFATSSVGNGKAVTVSGLTLTGSAAANYTLTQPTGLTANISNATVTITSGITANNKIYDGTTTATISSNNVSLSGVVAGDTANVALSTNGYTALFATASVGNSKAVTVSGLTLTGSAAANYTLTQPAGLTANISNATVTITAGITANNKTYDGTTTATISSNNVSLSGVVAGDTANVALSTNGYTASFATASVANGKAVTVSGLTLTGSAAVNYNLTQPSGLTANINAAPLTVTANNTNRSYGVANPAFTASYSGLVNSETASLVQGTPGFSTSATSSSPVSSYAITPSLGSLTATNYSFTTFSNGTLTLTKAAATNVVATSANPSPTGSNVTLTATVTAVSPASGTPTGTVQFLADGSALGAPATLSGMTLRMPFSFATAGTASISFMPPERTTCPGQFRLATSTLQAAAISCACSGVAPSSVIIVPAVALHASCIRRPRSATSVRPV